MKIKRKWFYIIAVIFFLYIGLTARLILASIVHRKYYNYSPIFFYILGLLGKLQQLILLLSLAFAIFIRSRDVARTCLVSFLFFLTFTTGIGGQYFIFPIALGALFPSIWFYLYSTVVTLFFLGNYWEFNIDAFKIFSWNVVWVFTFLWFLSELKVHLYPKGDVTLHLKNNTLSSPSTSTKVFPG